MTDKLQLSCALILMRPTNMIPSQCRMIKITTQYTTDPVLKPYFLIFSKCWAYLTRSLMQYIINLPPLSFLFLQFRLWAGTAQLVQQLATGWTVQGSNASGGEIFHTHLDQPWGPTQPPIQWVPGLSRGVKRPGRRVDHLLPSSAEVKERVELYIYIFPLWVFVACSMLNFIFILYRRSADRFI